MENYFENIAFFFYGTMNDIASSGSSIHQKKKKFKKGAFMEP